MCRTEEVKSINLASSCLEYEGYDGQPRHLDYDHIVIACGNISNLNVVPGMADHAHPLKTAGAAAVLRTHILSQMEKAEVCDDPARRCWYLSFLVVGGGYSGVETAGEINDLVRTSRSTPRVRSSPRSAPAASSASKRCSTTNPAPPPCALAPRPRLSSWVATSSRPSRSHSPR